MEKTEKKPHGKRGKGKRNSEVAQMAAMLGCNPAEILAMIAIGDWKGLGYESPNTVKHSKEGPVEVERITLQDRKGASETLIKYIHPQLKAVEHSVDPDQEHVFKPGDYERYLRAVKPSEES